jgi:hypothetical protein
VALEVFGNNPSAVVSSGGTDAPSAGTVETNWVLTGSTLPACSGSATPATQFHVADPAAPSEIILVTVNAGGATPTLTVTRGAESTTPVTHAAGFTIDQVITGGVLGAFTQGYGALAFNDLLTWAYDPAATVNNALLPAAATLMLVRMPLTRAISLTNLIFAVAIVATGTLTNSYVAAFTSAGTIIGQSADQSSVWQSGGSTGTKTVALAGGPYTVTPLSSNDFFWGAFYCGTASAALPQFRCTNTNASNALANAGTTTARSRFAVIAQANTATLASITPSSLSQASPFPDAFWMGAS